MSQTDLSLHHQASHQVSHHAGRFQTQVPGKWVLTGEHAVLRGKTAVALPLVGRGLTLSFQEDQDLPGLRVFSSHPATPGLREVVGAESVQQEEQSTQMIAALFQYMNELLIRQGLAPLLVKGSLAITSSVPMGAGFGSSAALCVALTQWLVQQGVFGAQEARLTDVNRLIAFATQLEHFFHGHSSGLDVAVIALKAPIIFSIRDGARLLGVAGADLPTFSFHDTHLRSRTREAVAQVQQLVAEQPEKAQRIDESMQLASEQAIAGLRIFAESRGRSGREQLIAAIQRARQCFYDWDLVPSQVAELEQELLAGGAEAVKLTGGGRGGILVALEPKVG